MTQAVGSGGKAAARAHPAEWRGSGVAAGRGRVAVAVVIVKRPCLPSSRGATELVRPARVGAGGCRRGEKRASLLRRPALAMKLLML